MIGIVIATHGDFGNSLLGTLRMIMGDDSGVKSATLLSEDSLETFQEKLDKALLDADPADKGALVLVDMLGGTPFNVAVQMARRKKIRVITGLNLPMLIKIISHRDASDLEALMNDVQKAAREGIVTTEDLHKKTGGME